MSVQDHRRAPFAWVGIDALEAIRCGLPLARQSGAREMLLTLAEAASNRRDGKHEDGDTVQILMNLSAMKRSAVRVYLRELEQLGLVRVDRRTDETGRPLPSVYFLVDSSPLNGQYVSPSDQYVSQSGFPGGQPTRARVELQEEKKTPNNGQGLTPDPSSDGPVREDVQQLCDLLASLMTENDPKAKVAPGSKGWHTSARLLLDKDERPLEEAERLLRWCQANDFWRSNILSMFKFREQYAKLRLQSERNGNGRGNQNGGVTAAGFYKIAMEEDS